MPGRALHSFSVATGEMSPSGTPGGPVGPNEWNATLQLYGDVDNQVGSGAVTLDATRDMAATVLVGDSSGVAISVGGPINSAPIVNVATDQFVPGFYKGWYCLIQNQGSGVATISSAGSTFGAAETSTYTMQPGDEIILITDGVNWQVLHGFSNVIDGGTF